MLEASFLMFHMNCHAMNKHSISPKESGSQAHGLTSAGLLKVRPGNLILGLGLGSFEDSADARGCVGQLFWVSSLLRAGAFVPQAPCVCSLLERLNCS